MAKTNLCPGTLEALDEEQGITRKPLTRAERQVKVLKELNLEALDEWPEELVQHVQENSSKSTMRCFHWTRMSWAVLIL